MNNSTREQRQIRAAALEQDWIEAPRPVQGDLDMVLRSPTEWHQAVVAPDGITRWYVDPENDSDPNYVTHTVAEAVAHLADLTDPRDDSDDFYYAGAAVADVFESTYVAPPPGEMQYRANRFLLDILELPEMRGRHVDPELLAWLQQQRTSQATAPPWEEPSLDLTTGDHEPDPIATGSNLAAAAHEYVAAGNVSWVRAIFAAIADTDGLVPPTPENADLVWRVACWQGLVRAGDAQ